MEKSTTFKKGDVVRLKSGGPQMTVMEVDGTRVACIWYREMWIDDGSEHYPTRTLDEEVLELSPLSTAAI